MLDGRRKLATESRMASQVVVREPSRAVVRATEDGYEVLLPATRRIWVADRLTQEGEVLYKVEFESGSPTPGCPHGLAVTRLSAALDPASKSATQKPSDREEAMHDVRK